MVESVVNAMTDFGLVDGPSPVRIPKSRFDLGPLFAAAGFTRGAEIGVWKGDFSESLCKTNPSLALLCVDPWSSYEEWRDPKNVAANMAAAEKHARRRLAPYRCEIVKAFSVDAAREVLDGSLDFVYVDANHSKEAVQADLHAWVPKVRSDGCISGHDYHRGDKHKHLHVIEAVNEYVATHAIAPLYVLTADKTHSFLWVKR